MDSVVHKPFLLKSVLVTLYSFL